MFNNFLKNFSLTSFKCLPIRLSSASPSEEDEIPTSSVVKNFNSLYDLTSDSTTKFHTCSSDDVFTLSANSDVESIPDLAPVFASQRFFFASPGRSNSIVDSPEKVIDGGVPIWTYSPDPYADFRRSMQEMVEARKLKDVKVDCDFLHELLLCYLTLNPKHTHKFIISAFADLIVSIMPATGAATRSRRLHHNPTMSRPLV